MDNEQIQAHFNANGQDKSVQLGKCDNAECQWSNGLYALCKNCDNFFCYYHTMQHSLIDCGKCISILAELKLSKENQNTLLQDSLASQHSYETCIASTDSIIKQIQEDVVENIRKDREKLIEVNYTLFQTRKTLLESIVNVELTDRASFISLKNLDVFKKQNLMFPTYTWEHANKVLSKIIAIERKPVISSPKKKKEPAELVVNQKAKKQKIGGKKKSKKFNMGTFSVVDFGILAGDSVVKKKKEKNNKKETKFIRPIGFKASATGPSFITIGTATTYYFEILHIDENYVYQLRAEDDVETFQSDNPVKVNKLWVEKMRSVGQDVSDYSTSAFKNFLLKDKTAFRKHFGVEF